MTALEGCILVMLEAIPYDGLMQRHQHLARELARFTQVIYVEATPSRVRRFLDGKPLDPALSRHKRGLEEVGENLWFFKAPPCMPRWVGYRRSIEGTSRRTAQSLRPLLPTGRPVILWLCSPSGLGALGLYDEALSIFDCYDAFGEFPGEERFRDEIITAMEECASRVDLVLATNEELKERLARHNPNALQVGNGCDAEHFVSGGRDPAPGDRALDIDSLPRPIIGYMGDIAPWVDLEYLTHAARRHPEWSIVLLGTWKQDRGALGDLPNVHAPGRVPYEELPYYARKFDVGTIPFALTDLTRVVNPLKLYEYFALGIPVVSTPLPEVARHEELVCLASTPDEFVALTEVALTEGADAPARSRRVALAKENSWRARGERIRDLVENLLERRGVGR